MTLQSVTDASFDQQVLQNDETIAVLFYVVGNASCVQAIGPLEAINAEYSGKLEIVQLNVDTNPVTTAQYSVTMVPTLLVFHNGEVVESVIGAEPKGVYERDLLPFLA